MTSADDMIRHLEREPESDIVAAMLTDELMESRGMLRTEADRLVARMRADAQDALDIAYVARLIRAAGPAHDALRHEVERVCLIGPTEHYTLYVVSGDRPPRWGVAHARGVTYGVGGGLAIALPATWARRWHERTGHPIRRPRRANRR